MDGVVALGDGTLFVSSWVTSAIYRIDPSGEIVAFVEGVPSPADIGYDTMRGLLLIPIFTENRIVTQPAAIG